MQENKQKFRAVKFRFETDVGTCWERYMIVADHIPLFRVNQWLELKSIRKASTGLEYAKKMALFLNWLDSHGVSFDRATNRHVRQFLHFLVFGDSRDGKIKSLQSTVGSSTLGQFVTIITGFYRWLDDVGQTEMIWNSKTVQANRSFLYGQIYSYEYRYLVDGYAAMLRPGREYIKWYDAEEKERLCGNFNTLRDEAVLRLTFEGFRIDMRTKSAHTAAEAQKSWSFWSIRLFTPRTTSPTLSSWKVWAGTVSLQSTITATIITR